ncbi:hypothetical protein [Streptomyces sp. NPDC101145]|uniref:hypothetical protein n=1 Tax=Streptomyces sp. NPDC101145 TaxID=3366112 RepID=UPI0038308902
MDRSTATASGTRQERVAHPTLTPMTDPCFAEALRRARAADERVLRPARRTLAEMAPGFVRQPLLTLHRPQFSNDAPCLFCDRWLCRGDCQGFTAGTALKAAA